MLLQIFCNCEDVLSTLQGLGDMVKYCESSPQPFPLLSLMFVVLEGIHPEVQTKKRKIPGADTEPVEGTSSPTTKAAIRSVKEKRKVCIPSAWSGFSRV